MSYRVIGEPFFTQDPHSGYYGGARGPWGVQVMDQSNGLLKTVHLGTIEENTVRTLSFERAYARQLCQQHEYVFVTHISCQPYFHARGRDADISICPKCGNVLETNVQTWG